MTREKFNEIFKNVIIPLKNEFDPDGITRFKPRSENIIFYTYQREKYKLKKYFMNNSEDNIDRHKISACVMYAIMKQYPIYIPLRHRLKKFFSGDRFPLSISYINEYIALYTAFSVLSNFYNQDLCENKLDKHRRQIIIPETFNEDYGFVFNMCIDLKFAKQSNSINILTYANVLFLMEYDPDGQKEQEN